MPGRGTVSAPGNTSPTFPLPPQAHERLEETKLEAVRDNNLELVQEILRDLAQLAEQSSTAAELARILQEPHFQVGEPTGRRGEHTMLAPERAGTLTDPPFLHFRSPSWRHMTLWPPRRMKHLPPVLGWTPHSATNLCLPTPCAWWASGRRPESTW